MHNIYAILPMGWLNWVKILTFSGSTWKCSRVMDSVLILKLKISTCTTRWDFARHEQRISIASTVCNSDPIMGKQLQTLHPHLMSQMYSTLHTLYSTQEVSFVLFHFDFNDTILNLLQKSRFFYWDTWRCCSWNKWVEELFGCFRTKNYSGYHHRHSEWEQFTMEGCGFRRKIMVSVSFVHFLYQWKNKEAVSGFICCSIVKWQSEQKTRKTEFRLKWWRARERKATLKESK